MNKTIIFTIAILLSINFSASAQWGNNTSSGSLSSGKTANVKFDKMEIDLGELKQNRPQDATFEMTNIGGKPIFITKAKGSCGCTSVKYPKRPIKPGETIKITATYDAQEKGVFNKTVTLTMNIEKSTQVLHITGVVR